MQPHSDPVNNLGNLVAGAGVYNVWTNNPQNVLSVVLTVFSIIWVGMQILKFIDDWLNKK